MSNSSRGLDAKVAEAMGLKIVGDRRGVWAHEGGYLFLTDEDDPWEGETREPCISIRPSDPIAGICEEPVEFYSTSGDGLLAMLAWHAEAGRSVFLTVMPFGSMVQIEHGESFGAATPGEALARATVAHYKATHERK